MVELLRGVLDGSCAQNGRFLGYVIGVGRARGCSGGLATVATGAIDPVARIAGVAARERLWLHVDGAYGALAAIVTPERFGPLARADSLSLDPHKWLHQAVDCGCMLFKDPVANHRTTDADVGTVVAEVLAAARVLG